MRERQLPLQHVPDKLQHTTAAGKTAICAGGSAAYKCLAVGANTKTIANGILAKLTAVLVPGATTPIVITSALATSVTGNLIPMKPIAGANHVSSDCRLHPPPAKPVRSR